jgi:hypothetical protein
MVRNETPDLASNVGDLLQIHRREHYCVENRQHLGYRREADTPMMLSSSCLLSEDCDASV